MSRGRILFVDDETQLRDSAREWLSLSGFSVEAAADAPAALRLLRNGEFEALVTDIRMPGTDGMALMLDAREADPSLPVILLTGHGDVSLAVEAMRGGAHDFLEKPYDADHLVAVIDRAVAARRLDAEVARLRARQGAEAGIE
ncbi:MAG: response regulator, partial [Rhizobiaceae bacterium]